VLNSPTLPYQGRPCLLVSSMLIPNPLLMAVPVSTITAANKEMKQVVDGKAGGKNPMLTSKHGVYDHVTAKHQVQIEKWACSLELWTPLCSSVTRTLSRMDTVKYCCVDIYIGL